MHRQLWLIACGGFLLHTSAAWAHDISGSFTTRSGDTYEVQADEDGTIDVTDSNEGYVGEAEPHGDSAWDIYATDNHYLGSIQADGNGNIVAHGPTGEFWGSGKTRAALGLGDDDDSDDDDDQAKMFFKPLP